MNYIINHTGSNYLPLSLRIVRLMISVLLVVTMLEEMVPWGLWKYALVFVAVYTLVTGLFGKDPLFLLFKLPNCEIPNHTLGMLAQIECLSIGLICIAVGIMYRHTDSFFLQLLPFLGVYPVLLCAVKHDLLSYLLQSYNKDIRTKKTRE